MDTHTPYLGHGPESYYEPFRLNDCQYETMLRTADYHYREIMDFFAEFDNNTIVVITGDHGKHEDVDLVNLG